jgi:DNA-directed RNA polymerase subunit RPC12/RpoP
MTPGELLDFHNFRGRNFGYLYYCPTCVRSFDSAEEHNECKFCSGNSLQILKKPVAASHKKKKHHQRYYCVKCQRTNVSNDAVERCQLCGGKIVHVYSWSSVSGRERLRMRFMKIRKTIMESVLKKRIMGMVRKPVDIKRL